MYKILQLQKKGNGINTYDAWSYVRVVTTNAETQEVTYADYESEDLTEVELKLAELIKTIPSEKLDVVQSMTETISVQII